MVVIITVIASLFDEIFSKFYTHGFLNFILYAVQKFTFFYLSHSSTPLR